MCYVHSDFIKHITVKGLPEHIKGNSDVTQEQFEKIIDPATPDVDHRDISLGIGIILCTSSMNKLRTEEAVIHLKGLNILLEPTIFGTTVSGEVSQGLRGSVDTVCGHNIVPRLVFKVTEPLFRTEGEEEALRENLHFLGSQESLGISPK